MGIDIIPLENNGITNRIFQIEVAVAAPGSPFPAAAIRFKNPADILAADPSLALENTAYVDFDFYYGGYIGLIFDIPGGSPYYGVLDIAEFSTSSDFNVEGSGFAIPEPTTVALVGLGGVALAARRRRD